jgi:hypothetical protein
MECKYFLVILSPAAIQSGWVEQEVSGALWQKLSERRQKAVIPCIRMPCEVPLHLRHLRYASFANGYAIGFAQIYSAIELPPIEDRLPRDLLPLDQFVAIERDAGNPLDHIRFACAHTIWSIRPDRAKYILENQQGDWRDYVAKHARFLLERYYP